MTKRQIMEYIPYIRSKVGHAPVILAGAAVLLLNGEGELLLLLRTDNGRWGIPGGAMEMGEQLQETAIRETQEETGLQVSNLELLDVFSGPDLYYRYPNGDEVYNVTVVYVARDVKGEAAVDYAEHACMQFFPLNGLPENISPPVKTILEAFRTAELRRK